MNAMAMFLASRKSWWNALSGETTVPTPRMMSTQSANQRQQSVPVEVLDEALKLTDPSGLDHSEVIRDGQLDQRRLTSIENEFRLNPASVERRLSYQKALQDIVHWQIKGNDLGSALSSIDSYLRLDPDNLQANLTLSWLLIRQGQYTRAENVLLKSRIQNNHSAELHYLLGYRLLPPR